MTERTHLRATLIALAGLALLAAGCGVPTLDIPVLYEMAVSGSEFYEQYPLLAADVPYVEGGTDLQVMDIFKVASPDPAPVIVFVHGGTWTYTTRKDYGALARTFTNLGYVTVIPDFRMYPDNVYPDYVNDTVDGLNWVLAHIAEYGGDPRRVFLMGHSAGAHLIAMVLTKDEFRQKLDFDPLTLRGLVLIAGPYHFNIKVNRAVQQQVFNALGSMENMKVAQPILYARGDIPPTLLLAGATDDLAQPQMNADYYEALKAKGAPVQFEVLPNNDHYLIVIGMAEEYRDLTYYRVRDFLNARLAATN